MSWQPIETAPKDGTAIQAHIPDHGSDYVIAWLPGFLDGDEEDCCAWVVVEEQEPPECWTDGVCWHRNDMGNPSCEPRLWKPLEQARNEKDDGE